jgi:hypothetical protein
MRSIFAFRFEGSKLMRSLCLLMCGLVLLGAAGGCVQGRPNWFSPGPAAYQRQRAQRFDPYPDDVAGPSIKDTRPPDYQESLPEPTRARWLQWSAPPQGY